MDKKVILIAPGGAGKDFLREQLIKRGYRPAISCTTRPKRDGEIDGVSYHFVTDEEFADMIWNDEFVEHNCFGAQKWWYGTTKKDFAKSNLFIMTPSGVTALPKEARDNSVVVYLDIPEDVRLDRLKARKDADDPQRRINTDKELFRDYTDFDKRVTDPFFSVDDILKLIA